MAVKKKLWYRGSYRATAVLGVMERMGLRGLAWRLGHMIHLSRPLYIGSTLCLNHCFDKIAPLS